MKEIDVRGLSCPEPVLIVMDEMDADPGQDLAVLADAAHTRDNIVKLAGEYKRDCRVGMRGMDLKSSYRADTVPVWKNYLHIQGNLL